jgi:hypothetical protein
MTSYSPESYPVDVVFADTQMDQIDLRFLLSNVLGIVDRDPIPNTMFSYAVVAQFLYGSPLLRPSAWRALMEVGGPMFWAASEDHCRRIEAWANEGRQGGVPADRQQYPLVATGDSPHSVYHVIVIDGQWVTWTGSDVFLELESGELLPKLECPGIEEVGYNLTELTRREWVRCLKMMKAREAGEA